MRVFIDRRTLIVLACVFTADATVASEYPEPGREIRHIIPWGAGGATDAAMRGFMQTFEKHLGVPVITVNVPGGLSAVGLLRVKSARPDGYTIGTMTYDILTLEFQGLAPVQWKDFHVLGMVTEHPSALIVQAERFADLEAFREAMVSGPPALKIGNVGTAGIWHQHAAAMEKAFPGSLNHVPYEAGSAAQLTALLGGEVDAIVASLPASLPHVREGTLRVLAVMAEERDPLVPEAPTFKESGQPLVFGGFRLVVAPRGLPSEIAAHLEAVLQDAFRDEEFQVWADKAALGARWRSAVDTRNYLSNLAPRVQALIEELGLR